MLSSLSSERLQVDRQNSGRNDLAETVPGARQECWGVLFVSHSGQGAHSEGSILGLATRCGCLTASAFGIWHMLLDSGTHLLKRPSQPEATQPNRPVCGEDSPLQGSWRPGGPREFRLPPHTACPGLCRHCIPCAWHRTQLVHSRAVFLGVAGEHMSALEDTVACQDIVKLRESSTELSEVTQLIRGCAPALLVGFTIQSTHFY